MSLTSAEKSVIGKRRQLLVMIVLYIKCKVGIFPYKLSIKKFYIIAFLNFCPQIILAKIIVY